MMVLFSSVVSFVNELILNNSSVSKWLCIYLNVLLVFGLVYLIVLLSLMWLYFFSSLVLEMIGNFGGR